MTSDDMETEIIDELAPSGKPVYVNPRTGGRLFPLGSKDSYSQNIRSKQKGTHSTRKSIAKQLIELKKKKERGELTEPESEILALIQNKDVSAMQIQSIIQELLECDLSIKYKIQVVKVLIDKQKALFPPLQKNLNLNMEFNSQLSEFRRVREELQDRELNLAREKESSSPGEEESLVNVPSCMPLSPQAIHVPHPVNPVEIDKADSSGTLSIQKDYVSGGSVFTDEEEEEDE